MACFLDSSALVKYYVTEPGSAWVRQQVDGEPFLVVAEITVVEVAAALGILQRHEQIAPRHRQEFWAKFERDCVSQYDLIPVGLDMIYTAAFLCARHPLRAYDAVQLAAGLALQRMLAGQDISLVFMSGDGALIRAAQAEGLAVDNPFWHTDLDPS